MDKKPLELIRRQEELCSKIEEDYNGIIKSNNSPKALLIEIKKLLSGYDREITNLLIFYRNHAVIIDKDLKFSELMKLVNYHKGKLFLLETQLQKIEKSSCNKCKKKVTTDNCHVYLWNEGKIKKWTTDEVTKFSFEDWERHVPLFCSESCFKQSHYSLKSKPDKSKIDISKKPTSNQSNICWECHQTKSKKWFINPETNLEFCSQVCNLEHNAELCQNCVQKCLKYENGIAVTYQTYYQDNETKTGILCFTCKQKQRKELTEELARLEKERSADKEEMARLKGLIESNDKENAINNKDKSVNNIERERLQQQITNLENKPNKTAAQEAELTDKKGELVELENQQEQESNKPNYRLWIIASVIGLLIVVFIFLVRKKKYSN